MLLCALLLGACGRPPDTLAIGSTVRHQAGFRITVPDGWEVRESRMSVSLVRRTPYGGGFPTLNVRRVVRTEADALEISGSSFDTEAGRVTYRYRSWSNARGRGYRLEALLEGPRGLLVTEASAWDPAPALDRELFEREFWPIVNSIVDEGTPPGEAGP